MELIDIQRAIHEYQRIQAKRPKKMFMSHRTLNKLIFALSQDIVCVRNSDQPYYRLCGIEVDPREDMVDGMIVVGDEDDFYHFDNIQKDGDGE